MKCVNLLQYARQRVVQERLVYLLPTTIINLIRFQYPAFRKRQEELDHILTQVESPEMDLPFRFAEKQSSLISSKYSLVCKETNNGYEQWHDIVREEIARGNPVAMATSSKNEKIIVRTILGYDDGCGYYLLYDSQLDITVASPRVVIVGGYFIYPYSEAKNDYLNHDAMSTLLSVSKSIMS